MIDSRQRPVESPLYHSALKSLEARPAFGTGLLQALREEASDLFRQRGLPHPKDEAWRFTKLRSVTDVAFAPAPAESPSAIGDWLRSELGSRPRIVLYNGRFHPESAAVDGVEVMSFEQTALRYPALFEQHLGRYASLRDGFSALNAALFEEGVFIRVPAQTVIEQPLEVCIVSTAGAQPSVSYPRLLVLLEPESRSGLIEVHLGQGDYLSNSVAEFVIGEHAALEHVRVAHGARTGRSISLASVEQARASRYASRVVTVGGALSRLHLEVRLAGTEAECSLDGLYLADAEEVVDHHTVIDHAAPHATSVEKYKGIVDGRGSAVFDGTIIVRQDAQGTSAHQENRNLILSDEASINTKPHLEIDADNVSCTHGATVGQVDEAALFYLRTRGIDEPSARAIITYAFASEMLDRIGLVAERERLKRLVLKRLGRDDLIEELT